MAFFVSLYFIHLTIGTAILARYFLSYKEQTIHRFGWGLVGYTLGILFWTIAVAAKPTDLKPLILSGVTPFLLAHLAFAKVVSKKNYLTAITLSLIVVTIIARTLIFPSEPYFSDQGLLFFGLNSVVSALYITTLSVSFLPAILAVTSKMKNTKTRTIMRIGFITLFINSVILVSSHDDLLLILNGFIMTITFGILWITALKNGQAPDLL
jgi:hypothetical protein